jgi:uncharacterized lipoprotein YehR (DUF1307 family)
MSLSRKLVTALLLAVLAFGVAACGGDDDDDDFTSSVAVADR